ncbi:MAG: hypothetical protein JWQ87_67 [Candidatus Sulfotelmatobacter sp.]|nr:hypothetical protein [Candidatus Sulfotelmatobacter sp.]
MLIGRGNYTGIVQFSRVAPYLVNPVVLLGFCLFLFFGIHRALLKAGLLAPLSQGQSSTVIRLILKYGLLVSIIFIILGFALVFRASENASRNHVQQGSITQQTGPCGSNIVGDHNKSDVNCAAAAKTK